MPAGVSWTNYLTFTTAAFLSMFAGSQVVHQYYKPLSDMDEYIKEEREKLGSTS